MLSDRQYRIIALLNNADGWIKGAELSQNLNISSKTLQKDIRDINVDQNNGVEIISNNRLGYTIKDKEKALSEFKNSMTGAEAVSVKKFTASKQIIMVLLFEEDYISIGNLAERLFMSKSSINNELAQVRRILSRSKGFELIVSTSKGLKIEAGENAKRIMCMKTMQNMSAVENIMPKEFCDTVKDLRKKVDKIVAEIFIEQSYLVSGDAYEDFALLITIVILRSKLGFVEDMPNEEIEAGEITRKIEQAILAQVGYQFTEAEICNIEARMRELNMIGNETVEQDNAEKIDILLRKMVVEVREKLHFKMQMTEELRKVLCEHLTRMMLRIESGRNNIGNYTKEMSISYPLEIHIIKTILAPILEIEIPDAEMGYLVLYLATIDDFCRKKPTILLVSDSFASGIFNIKTRINGLMGEKIKGIESIPGYLYEYKKAEYSSDDYIFVTNSQKIMLEEDGFLFLDEFGHESQLTSLWQSVNKREKERENVYREKRIELISKEDLPSKENTESIHTLDELLLLYQVPLNPLYTSIDSIGSNMLCVITHADKHNHDKLQLEKNHIWQIHLHKNIDYKGKHIADVFVVRFYDDEEPIPFFEMVSDLMKKTQWLKSHKSN